MLGGLAPVLIIHLQDIAPKALTNLISGIPIIGDSLANLGVPIPLYLDERLTGIVVDSESKAVDIETSVDGNAADATKPIVKQNGIDSTVTLNLVAKRDSILLSAFLALADQIFTRASTSKYSITYINGSTLIFNAYLKSISVNSHRENDLLDISISMSKANLKVPTPKVAPDFIPKVTLPA